MSVGKIEPTEEFTCRHREESPDSHATTHVERRPAHVVEEHITDTVQYDSVENEEDGLTMELA